jgi:membrane protein DedA with SNARE-associated domain
MHFRRFVVYTFLGSLPWSLLLTYLGYKLGVHWDVLRVWFHDFDIAIVVALFLALIFFLWWRRR